MKRYIAAERAFSTALAKAPDEPSFQLERANTYLHHGNLAQAEQDCDLVLAKVPGEPAAHRIRALARYGLGNTAGAVEDYTAALSANPTDSSLLAGRAHALLRLGRVEEAERDCAVLSGAGAGLPDALGGEGGLLLAAGDFEGASARYDAARKASKDQDWQFQFGLALLLSGRAAEALTAYRHGAEQMVPGDLQIALNDLDFWLRRYADRTASPEIEQASLKIRSDLRQRLEAGLPAE